MSRVNFTEEMDQKIKDNYLDVPMKPLATMIGISYGCLERRLKVLGLVIPKHIREERKKLGQRKKGDVPFNKGRKQSEYMSAENIANTAKTRFKKGNKPHNTAEKDGTISIRPDNKSGLEYKYIRTSLGVWDLYHRVVWEKVNGKIQDGYVVAFKDSNTHNCKIENLELITMRENMLRNSLVRFPKEVRKSYKLIWDINHKIQQNG